MKLLGIDFGKKNLGLAWASTKIAEPWRVLGFTTQSEVVDRLVKIIQTQKPDKLVVGISEGEMGKEAYSFGKKLEKLTKIKVEFVDETLSTQDAQTLAQHAGIKRKKRQRLEHAYSAALILQKYLDLCYT
jgi:putative Holliday junction resolvase